MSLLDYLYWPKMKKVIDKSYSDLFPWCGVISVVGPTNDTLPINKVFIVLVSVESNCHILQFVHQMFNVSALLLDDALLKWVVTEVVLFSIVAFKTLTFHKVV